MVVFLTPLVPSFNDFLVLFYSSS